MTLDYHTIKADIENLSDRIHAIADIMSKCTELDEIDNQIKPYTVGILGKVIARDILCMNSKLDDLESEIKEK